MKMYPAAFSPHFILVVRRNTKLGESMDENAFGHCSERTNVHVHLTLQEWEQRKKKVVISLHRIENHNEEISVESTNSFFFSMNACVRFFFFASLICSCIWCSWYLSLVFLLPSYVVHQIPDTKQKIDIFFPHSDFAARIRSRTVLQSSGRSYYNHSIKLNELFLNCVLLFCSVFVYFA